jgi:hypothetical protein
VEEAPVIAIFDKRRESTIEERSNYSLRVPPSQPEEDAERRK